MKPEEIEEIKEELNYFYEKVIKPQLSFHYTEGRSLFRRAHTLLSALEAALEEKKGLRERLAQKGMEYLELHKKSQSLWGALRKYGRHLPSCRAYGQQTRPQRCDCGFISALSRTEKEGGGV